MNPRMKWLVDYGAVGDGSADDTAAIQAAIDEIASRGGGSLTLPSGFTFLCGSLELKSGLELHLEAGSRLVASPDVHAFTRRMVLDSFNFGVADSDAFSCGAFLWAEDARDITISGTGVIDGSCMAFVLEANDESYVMDQRRPFPLFFVGCAGITIRDVRFANSALWTIRLTGCHDALIDGVRIHNDMRVPNADGIDLDHCTRVRIQGCDIITPDDGISLKTAEEFLQYGPCEDITITGCTIESRSTAITVGADTEQPLRNIVVSNCVIRNSNRGVSVSVGSGSGGYVENVLFSNLVIETRHMSPEWWGSGEPIAIHSAPWHAEAGAVRNVRFMNILARSENGIVIYASDPGHVEDVLLADVRLELSRWTPYPGRREDLRPMDSAPPFDNGATNAGGSNGLRHATPSAILIEGADNVRLRDVQVVWGAAERGEFGSGLDVRDSRQVRWDQLDVSPFGSDFAAIVIDNAAHEQGAPRSGWVE